MENYPLSELVIRRIKFLWPNCEKNGIFNFKSATSWRFSNLELDLIRLTVDNHAMFLNPGWYSYSGRYHSSTSYSFLM